MRILIAAAVLAFTAAVGVVATSDDAAAPVAARSWR